MTMLRFSASHFVTRAEKMEKAIQNIEKELEEQLKVMHENGKLLEAQRLEQRTRYDLEMMREMVSAPALRTIQDI